MAALGRRLQGTVKSPAGDASARASKVIVTRGGSLVAQARVGRDGAFRVAVPDAPDLVVTVFGLDNRVLRRRIKAGRTGRLDLGSLKLVATEFPPGIFGQAWDAVGEHPVTGGRATLQREEAVIATTPLDDNGAFAIELTENTLLLAGTYHLTVDVPGYAPAERTIKVTDDVTSYRIGRIELAAKTLA
jgi:hypothetical protein